MTEPTTITTKPTDFGTLEQREHNIKERLKGVLKSLGRDTENLESLADAVSMVGEFSSMEKQGKFGRRLDRLAQALERGDESYLMSATNYCLLNEAITLMERVVEPEAALPGGYR